MSCAQRKNFSVKGMARKVLGLKYHVLGLEMVVCDESNWSEQGILGQSTQYFSRSTLVC